MSPFLCCHVRADPSGESDTYVCQCTKMALVDLCCVYSGSTYFVWALILGISSSLSRTGICGHRIGMDRMTTRSATGAIHWGHNELMHDGVYQSAGSICQSINPATSLPAPRSRVSDNYRTLHMICGIVAVVPTFLTYPPYIHLVRAKHVTALYTLKLKSHRLVIAMVCR